MDVEALKRRLAAALRAGDRRRAREVKAELDATRAAREQAVSPPPEKTCR